MRWSWVLVLSSWGVLIGLITTLVGLAPLTEAALWFVGYVLWITVIHWRRLAPFQTGVAAGLLSGVAVGLVQGGLQGVYRVHNPDSVAQIPDGFVAGGMAFLAQGVVGGFLFGLVVGGIALGLSAIRSYRSKA